LQVKKQTKHQYIYIYIYIYREREREINEETITKFQISLQNENWEDVYDYGNVNSKFNIFLNIFLLNFENSFRLVHKKEDIINKWKTNGIRISCKRKRTLYSLVKKSSDERLKLYYKRYCNIFVKVIKEAKKLYYHKLISKSENKIQTTWKIIEKQMAKNQGMDSRK
jgi:hypothetical protein